MHAQIAAFVASAAEAFRLEGPPYCLSQGPPHGPSLEFPLPEPFVESGCVGLEIGKGIAFPSLPFPDGVAHTVLCLGIPEFCREPGRMAEEIARILSPGGVLLIAAPATPPCRSDAPARWQLTPRSIERLLDGMGATLLGWQGPDARPNMLYGVGFAHPVSPAIHEGTRHFLAAFQARLDRLAQRDRWPRRLARLASGWLRGPARRQGRRDYYRIQFSFHFSVGQPSRCQSSISRARGECS